MKNIFTLLCVITWGLAQAYTPINLRDLSQDEIVSIGEGLRPEWIVEISPGETLPLFLKLEGDVAVVQEVEQTPYLLELKKRLWVRCNKEEMLFSTDATNWFPIQELTTGTLGVAINRAGENLSLSCFGDVHLREQP